MSCVETFEHTADLGLRIRAGSLNELFQAAAEGLIGIIVANPEAIQPTQTEDIAISAEDPEDLLVAWLSEILYLSETRHRLYRDFDIQLRDDLKSLTATISGEPINSARHILDHEVKAVTRHGLFLKQEGAEWIAEVIVDI